jgi:predicted GIY-YIG superfamily endonuclease
MPFFTYILECCDGSYYTGHTDDLVLRVTEHGRGEAANYTSKRLPVSLVWYCESPTRDLAKQYERILKGWSRAKKLALISCKHELLGPLATAHWQRKSKVVELSDLH